MTRRVERRPTRAWLAAALLCAACGGAEPQPPNLVIVALDTLRPDHLGTYGYERGTSPGLDAFAERAVVFEQAESPAPWTAPAMISLVTGLHPLTHGVYKFPNPGRLNERAVTLTEVLRDHGYATGAFTEGGYAKGEFGLDQGFDVFPSNPGDVAGHMSNVYNPSRLAGNLDRALAWLEEQRDGPFFMLFHTYEVHQPLRAPDEYVRKFDPDWNGKAQDAELARVLARWNTAGKIDRAGAVLLRNHQFHCSPPTPQGLQNHMHEHGLLPEDGARFYPETLQFIHDQYDAEIAYTDAQLDRLWSALRENGLEDNTIVIVVSDHGEALGEHGIVGHGSEHVGAQLGVVFMVRAPGLEPARISETVSSLSVMATALDLLGLPPVEAVQGRSLATLAQGEATGWMPTVFSQGLSLGGGEDRILSMRTGSKRLVLDTESGEKRMFDLETDPGELRDVTAEQPDVASQMARAVAHQVEVDLRGRATFVGEVGAAELDDATQQRLQELGYIDGDDEDQ